jgi:hypothetical protein
MFCRLALLCVAILLPASQSLGQSRHREPVAVAYLSSVDAVMSDIEYIVTAGGRPEVATMIQGFVTNLNNLDGIDRTKPIGFYAFVPLDVTSGKKDPDIVAFIPVTSVEALQKTAHLSNVLSLEGTDKPERYEFKTPEKTFAVQLKEGHAFLTEKAELLDTPLPAPEPFTSALSGQYDVVIQVRKEGVPKFLWDLVLFGAVGEFDKQAKKLKEDSSAETQAQLKVVQLARSVTIATLSEVQSAWVGLKISRESRTAQVDVKLQFADAGKVGKSLLSMVEGPSPLDGATADAAGSVHVRASLPGAVSQLMVEGLKIATDKNDPLKNVPESHRQSVTNLIDVVTKTVGEGQADVVLQFTGEPQTGMTVVAGIHVAEGRMLADSLTQLLPEAKGSDKVEAVTLDAGTARGVKFARIDGHQSGTKEQMFYGGQPSLYIGIQPDTVWLLVGDTDALNDFESLETQNTNRTASGNLIEAQLHLSDWLGLLGQAQDQKTRDFTEAARAAIKDPDHDAVTFTVRPESDGLKVSLTLDEVYLSLFGAAVGKE